ncbi:hypothetical protein SAMN05443668_103249 [Cryptosporangium aurantiacum]|uniref:Uncharacterized protein n=1 Tax=Cryptosporangium aurantiacum TaxID=134849 RepID=A0A1M7PDQ8_9ACTN|nr:hypothetical protein SAMN05443668_103249 [Cryptosporangium aurantiacum]
MVRAGEDRGVPGLDGLPGGDHVVGQDVVFRSILVSPKASLGILLTVTATVAVFGRDWLAGLVGLDSPGPLISFLQIRLVGSPMTSRTSSCACWLKDSTSSF